MPQSHEFQARMQRLDDILQESDQTADPATQARLQEVTAGILELHKAALERVMEQLSRAGEPGEAMLDRFTRDEMISGMLVLHGLHPLDLEGRVRQALDNCAPYLASHGGHVELLSISEEGTVHLKLHGSCHGCPSSRVTLQSSIEQEIYAAAPEITAIDVDGLVEPAPVHSSHSSDGFVPLGQLAVHGVAIAAAS